MGSGSSRGQISSHSAPSARPIEAALLNEETPDGRTLRRLAAVQPWLEAKAMEARGTGFYGELSVTLKFEEGQCTLVERLIRERAK